VIFLFFAVKLDHCKKQVFCSFQTLNLNLGRKIYEVHSYKNLAKVNNGVLKNAYA